MFRGRDATDNLFNFIQQACPGCKLDKYRVRTDGRGFLHLELRCQCYAVRNDILDKNFENGKFSKSGTVVETVVKKRKVHSFQKLGSSNLKAPRPDKAPRLAKIKDTN